MPLEGWISEHHLLWVLAAPLIPLAMLIRGKLPFRQTHLLLTILCSISVISHIFVRQSAGTGFQNQFMQQYFFLELILTALLLQSCTDHKQLRSGVIAFVIIFAASYLTFLWLLPGGNYSLIFLFAVLLIFISSTMVLFYMMRNPEVNMMKKSEFWFAGGIFFHFGFLSLLLISRDLQYLHVENDSFSLLYVIILFIQALFFAAGIIIPQTTSTQPTGMASDY